MISNGVVIATLPVTDAKRARDFYVNKLGLKVVNDDPDMLILEAGEHTFISLYQRPTPTIADQTVAGFVVDNLDQTIRELKGKGVTFEEYDLPNVKTKNGIATMDEGRGAWFKDPDGNILGVVERVTERSRRTEHAATFA